MSIRSFSEVPQTLREWQRFFKAAEVTPTDGTVGPDQLAATTITLIDEHATDKSAVAIAAHEAATDPHPQYAEDGDVLATATTVAAAAVSDHASQADPHSQYINTARGDARYLALANILTASTTFDPPSLADGTDYGTSVTVAGAALGDFALASFSSSTLGVKLTAMVTASNTVTVVFSNGTGGTVDLPSGTLRARVFRQ